jgi:sugar transferase EpsL
LVIGKIKRVLDIVLAGGALLLLFPLVGLAGAVVFFALGRPLFFRDERIGVGGTPIAIFKFRTMANSYDSGGGLLPDAERLSRAGRVLRGLSLDELPQLISVLRGEMSLVGPRPLPTRYLSRYSPAQARRHDVKPGITGLAQVSGRNLLSWDEKFALDVWYVDNWSFWLDIKILFSTVWVVLRRSGIQAEGEATMSEFLGSASAEVSEVGERVGAEGRKERESKNER